ncbi:ABC transporter substrate-binding protein [Pseudochelatococcus lubricantis]|uniref:ABC transporter substrate-binding protein n=1 Tax=Pseudochelatococcus lubricantis TaxID=1538102 RepID=UPI0035EA1E01
MELNRRHFSSLLAVSAASLAGGPWFSRPARAEEPVHGGTLVFVQSEQPTNLVALLSPDVSRDVSGKIVEGLLDYDFDLKPIPQLAVAWEVSEDGLRYTFRLRQGVKWHDGKDFTSADVAHSIGIVSERHSRARSTFANLAEIQTPDDHTVVLLLSQPAPYLLGALPASEVPIVPKHLYEGKDPGTNPVNARPVGTGPFVYKEWVRGSHILLERNPNYWDQPKPYVDRIVFRTITDPGARTILFETGEAHIASTGSVPLSELKRLLALPHLEITTKGQAFNAGVTRLEFNLDNDYLKRLPVRQAIAHAIDKQAILDTVFYGYGAVVDGPISVDLPTFFSGDLPHHAHDPAKAEKLLDEAGLPRGEGGTRFKLIADPRNLYNTDVKIAEYVRSALANVGINVTIRSQDFASYIKRVYRDRDFELIINSMTNTFDPTIGVQRLYWSKNFKPGVPFSNASHYSNPEVDRLLEEAAVSPDQTRRVALFNKFQQIVAAELPDINLLSNYSYTLSHKRLRQHTVSATGIYGNFADAYFSKA